ncbi:MAG TPA: protein kinase [Kofleriaceae bacterium]|nr:protein kinase [Kofleriaceae bacterium]
MKVGEVSTLVDDGSRAVEGGQRSSEPVIAEVDPSHYYFEAVVARGGAGIVLRAIDRRLRRPVAVKQILRGDGTMQTRFEREAWLTARLQHPGIVPIYEAGRWPNGESFYAMRLVEGRPLSEVIADCSTLDDRLALLPKVVAVSEAVAYAHTERVLHRDLKPHNVMIGPFGDVVVIDWGLAKDLGRSEATGAEDGRVEGGRAMETIAGAVVGTPAYMPPEQARGEPVDERADVYALGALLYHVLTGAPPFVGASNAVVLEQVLTASPPPVEVRQPGVPRDLAAVIGKAMAADPGARYATAGELSQELQRFVTGQLVQAHQYPRAVLARRALRRHPLATAVGVFAMVLALLGGVAVRRIVVAKAAAESRGRELLLGQARALLETDPTASVALLKRYPARARGSEEVRAIALDAESRGVARHVLSLHADAVRDVAFSPDGAQVASAGADGALFLWDVATGAGQRLYTSHTAISNVLFDPSGRYLAVSLGPLPGMLLWDRRQRTSRRLPLEDDVYTIAFSPDGAVLAGGAIGGAIYLWGVADGVPRALTGHDAWIMSVDFSPDGQRLLSTSQDGTARIWTLATGAARVLALGAQGYNGSFSPDGRWAAVGCEDGRVHLYSVADEAAAPRVFRVDGEAADFVAFSSDASRLAWAGFGPAVHVVDLRTNDVVSLHGHDDDVIGMRFLPDDGLLTASADGTMRRWDLASGLAQVLRGHSDQLIAMAVSARGDRVASAGADHGVRLWELAPAPRSHAVHASKEGEIKPTPGNDILYFEPDGGGLGVLDLRRGASRVIRTERPFARFAGHPAGQRLAYRDLQRRVHIVELGGAGPVERPLPEGLELSGGAIEFSPDGKTLAFPGWRGVHLVDAATMAARELAYPSGPIQQRDIKIVKLQFSADGRRLLGVRGRTELAEIVIWDIATGRPTVIPPPPPRTPGSVFASPDLSSVAAGVVGGLWILDRDRSWRQLMSAQQEVYPIAFSGDGRLMASADAQGPLRLWRASDGAPLHELVGHRGPIRSLSFDRDGGTILSAGVDGAARLWDVRTGRELRAIRASSGREVMWAGFRGTDIVTAGRDGTVRVWPAASHRPGPVEPLLDALTSMRSDR